LPPRNATAPLDVLSHAPDLPLTFDRSPKVGLGLEYSPEGDIHWRRALVAKIGLLAAGLAIDRRSRR
jgi:hypothetical protein